MVVKMYLYPMYVSFASAKHFSPKLFALLKERSVKIETEYCWDGSLETIPNDGTPVIIRASSRMKCSPSDLAKRCAELGHFVFYDDFVIRLDGEYDHIGLLDEARQFLDRVGVTA